MSTDLDSIRRRHDEDHEHDGGCDTLDLLAEVERLRAAMEREKASAHEWREATERRAELADREFVRAEKAEAEALRWKTAYEMAEPVLTERDRLRAAVDAVRALVAPQWRSIEYGRNDLIDDICDSLDEHLGSPGDS